MAIVQTLQRTNWNKQEAAQILGLYRPTLYSKMKKHEIKDAGKAVSRGPHTSGPARIVRKLARRDRLIGRRPGAASSGFYDSDNLTTRPRSPTTPAVAVSVFADAARSRCSDGSPPTSTTGRRC